MINEVEEIAPPAPAPAPPASAENADLFIGVTVYADKIALGILGKQRQAPVYCKK
jgi:hypothetical protein